MVRYKMLGRDIDASPVQYRTWIVNDQPDFTGAHYTGHKSGSHPFVDVVAYAIFDPNIVVDFNLPNALDWSTTKRVLPSTIVDSQLAVIDGYVYLFGGQNSAKIFRATLDNPTDWSDTGATLPSPLAGSQLLVLDGYIFLFGGTTDATYSTITNNIFTAQRTNPLVWTNQGALLPRKIHHSQLAVIDGYIYLFGGNESNTASNAILRAPSHTPLVWSDTGSVLPEAIYGSQLAILDGYVCLFGGLLTGDSPTNKIFRAPLTNPTSWVLGGILPHKSYFGQFVAVGDKGYLITPTDGYASYTRILQCNINNPFSWTDTKKTVPGTVNQSQLAIIYDRLFLFGGNGSTIIFANNSIFKYQLYKVDMLSYGFITRTEYKSTLSQTNLFAVLGFPYWKTDYESPASGGLPIVVPPPVLSSISPGLGDIDGGIWVELIGTHLLTTTSVLIGGTSCTNLIIVSDSKVWCKTPAKSAGIYDVKIITGGGDYTLIGAFESWDATQITSPATAHVYDSEEGLTLVGNLVNAWNDQGSLAANLTGSGATRPTYLPNRFGDNLRHGLNFEPPAAVNSLTLAAPLASANRSVFAVFKWLATAGGDTSEIISGTSGSIYDFALDSTGGLTTMRLYDANTAINHRSPDDPELSGGAAVAYTDGGNGGSGKLIGEIVDGTTGFVSFYLNNIQQGSAQAITIVGTNWKTVGSGAGNQTAGELGAVVVVEDIITASDRAKLVTWMWGKWLARSSAFSRENNNTPWFARDGGQLLALGDTVFMLGGWNHTGGGAFPGGKAVTNEIWRSTDKGVNWTLIKANDYTPAPANSFWTPRHAMGAVVHNIGGVDYLYVIGSDIYNGPQNNTGTGAGTSDVWRSPDGVNWARMTDTAPWGPRTLHFVASFKGNLYLMGGMTDATNPTSVLNDVWKSTDGGVTWILLGNAPWASRAIINSGQGLPIFNDKLWMMGGGTYVGGGGSALYNDVWSFDGTTWVLVTAAAAWSPRQYHTTVSFEGKLWVLNGVTDFIGTNNQECWNSPDGINWFEQTITPWRASHADGVIAISDRIVVGPGNGQINTGSVNGIGTVYAITRLGFVPS